MKSIRINWDAPNEDGVSLHQRLVQLRGAGKTLAECSHIMGFCTEVIARHCNEQSIPRPRPARCVSDDIRDAIRGWWPDRSITKRIMGERLGITELSVVGIASRMGLKRPCEVVVDPAARDAARLARAQRDNDARRNKRAAARAARVPVIQPPRVPKPRVRSTPASAPAQDASVAKLPGTITVSWPEAEALAIQYGRPADLVRNHGPRLDWLNAKRAARGEAPVAIRPTASAAGSDLAFSQRA